MKRRYRIPRKGAARVREGGKPIVRLHGRMTLTAAEARAEQEAGFLIATDPSLGAFQEDAENVYGGNDFGKQTPGLLYGAGPQTQPYGARGTRSEGLAARLDALFDGLPQEDLPSGATMEVFSRMLEQTFRNFYVHALSPPWLQPPFQAQAENCLDIFETITFGPAASDTVILTMDPLSQGERGVIVAFAHELENAAAFADVTVTLKKSGKPLPCYTNFNEQLADFGNPRAGFSAPITHLRAGDAFQVVVRSANAHTGSFRFAGWKWLVRAEMGQQAKSTLTD